MLVVFRADANSTIGTGHVMRCLALAEALAARGDSCHFLCREYGLGALGDRIRQEGHTLHVLPEGPASPRGSLAHSAWLPHGQAFDASTCIEILVHIGPVDWLVVDHYALDQTWEKELRPQAAHILAIDDLADRTHDCDLLLDQTLRPDSAPNPYASLLPVGCRTRLGPHYALLRSEFSNSRRYRQEHPRVLVMFGGADRENLTTRTINQLAKLGPALDIDVITGALFPYQDNLREALANVPNAQWHQAPSKIAPLMAIADFAIGSPGSTSWERCALHLPSITLAVADNQIPLAEALALRGAHLYLGGADQVEDKDIAAALQLMISNPLLRESMSRQAATIADGKGALRIAREMHTQRISVRPATPEDARLIHQWRNDPRTRRWSFDAEPIPLAKHIDWFAKALANPARVILIGCLNAEDIGCVRFDLMGDEARVSIFLDPDRHGEGLASPLLQAADEWLSIHHPDKIRLRAEVLADNAASTHAFENAGYRLEHRVFVKKG